MDPLFLAADFPRLYHVAEAGSWESIRRHGLLSTSALLDLFEVQGELRQQLESEHRPRSVPITHPLHGSAVIRDQNPLNMTRLAGCLTGMSAQEWLRELNRRVFFWPSEQRLTRLLGAKAYRDQEHDVLIVDTRSLVERHRRNITLAPINTGATIPTAAPASREPSSRSSSMTTRRYGRNEEHKRRSPRSQSITPFRTSPSWFSESSAVAAPRLPKRSGLHRDSGGTTRCGLELAGLQ